MWGVAFSDWCVWFFVKYWQDGFTKIQTHAMTRWCVAFFGLVRLVLCKILARWVYKIQTHAMWLRCFFSDWRVWFFVKYWQDKMGLQRYKRTRCDALLCFGLVRLVLCKILARWVYKDTNARDDTMMRHLANILPLYKRIHPKKKATHRHVIACVCIIVNQPSATRP